MNNKTLVTGLKKSWCYQIQLFTIEDTFICTRNSEKGCSDEGTEGGEQISGTLSTGLGEEMEEREDTDKPIFLV